MDFGRLPKRMISSSLRFTSCRETNMGKLKLRRTQRPVMALPASFLRVWPSSSYFLDLFGNLPWNSLVTESQESVDTSMSLMSLSLTV